MPRGTYLVTPDGAAGPLEERFSCAAGPVGWRYTSTLTVPGASSPAATVDVTVEALWRPVRVDLRAGEWAVRGGSMGAGMVWVRRPGGIDRRGEEAHDAIHGQLRESRAEGAVGFHGVSAAFSLLLVRALARLGAGPHRLTVVTLGWPGLGPLTRDLGVRAAGTEEHDTDLGRLVVEHYDVVDLSTGEAGSIHVAGDVVLAAPGVELASLDSPPTPLATRSQ